MRKKSWQMLTGRSRSDPQRSPTVVEAAARLAHERALAGRAHAPWNEKDKRQIVYWALVVFIHDCDQQLAALRGCDEPVVVNGKITHASRIEWCQRWKLIATRDVERLKHGDALEDVLSGRVLDACTYGS